MDKSFIKELELIEFVLDFEDIFNFKKISYQLEDGLEPTGAQRNFLNNLLNPLLTTFCQEVVHYMKDHEVHQDEGLYHLKWDMDFEESNVIISCQIKEDAEPSPQLINMASIFEVRSAKLLSDIQDELDSVTNILHQRIPPTVEVLFVTNFEEEVAL